MKKTIYLIKKWWFSVIMWLFAISFVVYTIIAINTYDEELLFITMVCLSCVAPTMMCLIIGFATMPQKEK